MKVGDRMVYTKVSELNDNWHYCMTEQEYKKLREMILMANVQLQNIKNVIQNINGSPTSVGIIKSNVSDLAKSVKDMYIMTDDRLNFDCL